VRVTGPGNASQYVQVNKKAGLNSNAEWNLQNQIPEDFECDIDFKPEPPGGFQAKMERDLQLLQAQVVDSQFVQEDLDFDQATIQAIQQRMSQQAQAAQQQQLQMIMAQGKAKCQCSGNDGGTQKQPGIRDQSHQAMAKMMGAA
jgi:hypothetical protein